MQKNNKQQGLAKPQGLTTTKVDQLLAQYGLNEIKDVSKTSVLTILVRQVKSNFLIYLLITAMLISFAVGKTITGDTIAVIIFVVVLAGFMQEYRAEKTIQALKSLLVPVTIVIRNGKEQEISSTNIVPGDVVVLRAGEKIPADCLLLEEQELRVNEAILTGESGEIRKKSGAEQKYSEKNMVFMGSYVVNGRGMAKVLHTGMNTRFGAIAGLVSTTQKELPLQKKVNVIAKYMTIIALAVSVITGILMLTRSPMITGELITTVLILVIALSVSAFPEGLPVVLLTTLASGAYRMAKQHAIVNRMSIIETLGETTVICADKTGTITRGEMTVTHLFANNKSFQVTGSGYESVGNILFKNNVVAKNTEPVLQLLIKSAVLCNDAVIQQTYDAQTSNHVFKTIGTPTESALLILAAKAGIYKDDLFCDRIHEIPFSSERKMMSVLCKHGKEKVVYSKGAPEYLLKHCKFMQTSKGVISLNDRERKKIFSENNKMTRNTLRTVGFAYKKTHGSATSHTEEGFIFVGIAGIEDPPRQEVRDAIRVCQRAGIQVKMITGDNKETALAIAKEIHLQGKSIEGEQLDNMTDEELSAIVQSTVLFARVKPEHKLRIVHALKLKGEIVAMTGDGVNDAPALKEAHIGIAMGKNGTDVSRSAADLVLQDDHFSTIVNAISEGRTIFSNIRKFVTYQLSCNLAELLILFVGVLVSPVLGWQIPLLVALQLLFMNLVTDNLPAITLGFNPGSKDSMQEKPRKKTSILSTHLIGLLIFTACVLAFFVLGAYYAAFNKLGMSSESARTIALVTLICLEIGSAFTFRSFRKGVFTRSPFVNPWLFCASVVSLLATGAVVYVPALNTVFETVPLTLTGILVAISAAVMFVILFDLLKYVNNKKRFFEVG